MVSIGYKNAQGLSHSCRQKVCLVLDSTMPSSQSKASAVVALSRLVAGPAG